MAKNLDSSQLFNPVTLWTDLSMRALETTLSSAQNMSEGLNRLTRAGASTEASEQVEASSAAAAGDESPFGANAGLALIAQMQRTTFELMTQAWRQWMNTLVSLGGVGRGFGENMVQQNPWLDVMREGLRTSSATASHRQASPRSETRTDTAEHAFARAEPKRRSGRSRSKSKASSRNV